MEYPNVYDCFNKGYLEKVGRKMDTKTKNLLDQIVSDKELLQKKMLWEADAPAMATLASFLFASSGRRADIDRYVECKKYFKKNVNVFSEMRGISATIVITKMCLADNYEEYLAGVTEVYKKLRKIHKFTASPYMVLASINIFEAGGVTDADKNIEKLETVYKEMKSEHFLLTGDEDRPFLAMLVSRDISINSISSEISACYEACKSLSFSKEAMHTASQIMSLSGKNVEAKVSDLKDTMAAFKEYKIKGMKYELMPMAATLGLVESSPESKAIAIKENYDYLKTQKGFKWYLSGTKRSLYSILAYALVNLDESATALNSVISTTLTNIIIEEIILLIIISSSVSSTGSSSSN